MQYFTVIREVGTTCMYSNDQHHTTSSYHASFTCSTKFLLVEGFQFFSYHCHRYHHHLQRVHFLHQLIYSQDHPQIFQHPFHHWHHPDINLFIESKYIITCTSEHCGPRPGICCRSSLSFTNYTIHLDPQLVSETMHALETQLLLKVL